MIDECDRHLKRAQQLLAAWNALWDDSERALRFGITEAGFVIHFEQGGGGYKGPTLDAAFDDMERAIRAAAASDIAERRQYLDESMARARACEEALSK